DAACGIADGSVALAVQPAGNYTYQWSNGQTTATVNGLAAGTYTVTVTNTDLVCTQTQAYTINNVNGPVLSSITADDALCNGGNGSAEVQVSGGTPGYTYLWSNGSTSATPGGLTAGTYNVTVTDANGCTTTNTITVTEPTPLTSTTAVTSDYNGQDVSCNGASDGAVSVTPAGGT
ncbi:MAG: SprB repeat-containing protein, partial [Saprospiraceae bacterium]